MESVRSPVSPQDSQLWVSETRFGKWFLGTQVWRKYVLEIALQTLRELVGGRLPKQADMLDIGCGEGQPFLQIYWVRWLFRHPDMEQKTATGYMDLIKESGFVFSESDVLQTTPWWSRRDLGFFKKIGLQFWTSKTAEIFIIASKPE